MWPPNISSVNFNVAVKHFKWFNALCYWEAEKFTQQLSSTIYKEHFIVLYYDDDSLWKQLYVLVNMNIRRVFDH